MSGGKFNFVPQKKKETVLEEKKILERLMKWSMKGNIKMQHFNFNEQFHPHQKQDFVDAFFKDPNVYSTLQNYYPDQSIWAALGNVVEKVEYEMISATQTSMAFFDKILDPENNIVRENGDIRLCMEEPIDGFFISNSLGAMLMDENSDVYSLYSKSERNEFLFCLLRHFVLGGLWCQWEDKIQPYLEVVKSLYKELMSVEREEGSSRIRVRSVVLKTECLDRDGKAVFPRERGNIQNFCYLIVDPFKRTVTALTHFYGATFNL